MYKKNIVIVFCVLMVWVAGHAADLHVSLDGTNNAPPYTSWGLSSSNLIAVVNSAVGGDIIIVSNGTYYLTNELHCGTTIRNLILTNWSGNPETTILDGNYPHNTNRCIYFAATSGVGTVISGFTIRNGYALPDNRNGSGGGFYAIDKGRIENCIVISNRSFVNSTAYRGGGGIYANRAVVIDRCRILYNTTTLLGELTVNAGGGGVSHDGVNVDDAGGVFNSVIAGNSASNSIGGGLLVARSVTVSNVVVSNNWSGGKGGVYGGGGVYLVTYVKLLESEIIGNHAEGIGGGVVGSTLGLVRNCLMANNVAVSNAGGIYVAGPTYNCTVVSNYSGYRGGGTHAVGVSNFVNGIIYSNACGFQSALYPNIYMSSVLAYTAVTHTCVFPYDNSFTVPNVVTNEPAFESWSVGNYRLQINSPCINVGLNYEWMDEAPDLDGRSRIDRFSGKVDMGCYEYVSKGMLFKSR